eukprot:ctg_1348.g490
MDNTIVSFDEAFIERWQRLDAGADASRRTAAGGADYGHARLLRVVGADQGRGRGVAGDVGVRPGGASVHSAAPAAVGDVRARQVRVGGARLLRRPRVGARAVRAELQSAGAQRLASATLVGVEAGAVAVAATGRIYGLQ